MGTTRLLRRVLRSVLETAFEKVLKGFLEGVLQWVLEGGRVLEKGSKKGLSRRHLQGGNTPFYSTTPLACALTELILWRTESVSVI